MDSRPSYLGSMRPLIAVMARALAASSALSAIPACVPQDSRVSDELTGPDVGIRHRSTAAATSPYTLFESGQVRPLAM